MVDTELEEYRRKFIAAFGLGVGGLALDGFIGSAAAAETPASGPSGNDFQAWLKSIPGKYRQVYDMTEPNGGFGLIWSFVYLLTGPQAFGVPESDLGVVVVVRHNATPIALADAAWSKYKLGEFFKINDPATKAPALRNPFNNIKPGDMPAPDAAIDKLVPRGVKITVCNMAITFYSGMVAKQIGADPAAVKKDWTDNVLPGIHIAPSGVVALNGAQAVGCKYVFAG